MKALTTKTRRVLEHLVSHLVAHGCPPSAENLARHFGWRHPGSFYYPLAHLEARGLVRLNRTRDGDTTMLETLVVTRAGYALCGVTRERTGTIETGRRCCGCRGVSFSDKNYCHLCRCASHTEAA